MHWSAHDTLLVVWTLVGIAVVVVLISWAKLHPFLALILGSAVAGLGAGLSAADVIKNFESGFGTTLAGVGILVALGTILGKLLADSGGADQVVDTIVRHSGQRRLPWAMALIAMIIGIPLFFEVGLVLLIPVIFLVARRAQTSIVRIGIPALAGLSVMHGLVPPHPGPLIAISALNADLGRTLMYGLIVAIPTVIIAGPLYGQWIGNRLQVEPPAQLIAQFERQSRRAVPAGAGGGGSAVTAVEGGVGSDRAAVALDEEPPSDDTPARAGRTPAFGITLLTVLLPVILMLARAIADIFLGSKSGVRHAL